MIKLAMASVFFGFTSVVFLVTGLNLISAPISIITGLVGLKIGDKSGKGLCWIGIVLSAASLVITLIIMKFTSFYA